MSLRALTKALIPTPDPADNRPADVVDINAAEFEPAIATASAADLEAVSETFETSASILPDQREWLRNKVNARVETIAKSGEARGPVAAQLANQVAELRAQTVGVFSGILGVDLPDPAVLNTKAQIWHDKAVANASNRAATPLVVSEFKDALRGLIGINTGSDQIVSVHATNHSTDYKDLAKNNGYLGIDAFDAAGYHVLHGDLCVDNAEYPQVLYVAALTATHGRNVEDLNLLEGETKVPGRGNARLIAQAFESAIEASLDQGFTQLACMPGGPSVAKLYFKMGFRYPEPSPGAVQYDRNDPDGYQKYETMFLDLTSKERIDEIVFVFAASRAAITDVPKNVSERIAASGKWLSPPALGRDDIEWPFLRTDDTQIVSLVKA